jgi:hypothetical protein
MRQILRVAARYALAAMIAAAGTSPFAMAATPEQAYIAARDAAIAKIKAIEKAKPVTTNGDNSATLAAEEQARKALEVELRAIVGPVAIKGLEGEGAINLETLFKDDEDFGVLDGMIYGPVDAKTRVIVTTDGLFQRWLHQHKGWWGKDSAGIPLDPGAAVKVDAFYTQAVQTDAAIMRFAELPVRKPAGATFAFAMLAARSQSDAPAKADEIFVATAQGGRVFIGYTSEFEAVGPIAVCDKIHRDLTSDSVALSDKADAEFLRCFAAQASKQKGFAGATAAAQALMDRLPTR